MFTPFSAHSLQYCMYTIIIDNKLACLRHPLGVCTFISLRKPDSHTHCLEGMHTYKHLRCWIVHVERFEDGRAIICDHHLMAPAHALQDLVLQSHPAPR